jgi:cytochrome c5
MKKLGGIIFFSILILSGCYYDNKADLYQYYNSQCDTTAISYSLDIEPIINAQCLSCHQGAAASAGRLLEDFTTVKASATDGSLFHSINGTGGYSIMPQSGKMSQCNIDKIDAWIKAGTPNN